MSENGHMNGAEVDRVLANELCNLLMPFAGETGRSEGAVDVLKRKLAELTQLRIALGTSPCDECSHITQPRSDIAFVQQVDGSFKEMPILPCATASAPPAETPSGDTQEASTEGASDAR